MGLALLGIEEQGRQKIILIKMAFVKQLIHYHFKKLKVKTENTLQCFRLNSRKPVRG